MKQSSDRYNRQAGIIDIDLLKAVRVTLVGAGGIGSPTALVLAKMGVGHINIYDPDKVEEHNLPNQYYKNRDVGYYKVSALGAILDEYSEISTRLYNGKFKPGQRVDSDVVVIAVDDMDLRGAIWKKYKKTNKGQYIEARMGGESFRVYSVDMQNAISKEAYGETLYSSKEAEQTPCTEKATMYNVSIIAGIIGSLVKTYSNDGIAPSVEIIGDIRNLYFVKNNLTLR